MMELYSSEYYITSDTLKQHMLNTYGAEHAMQVPELLFKAQMSGFRLKPYCLPCGKTIYTMGYEKYCIRDLLAEGIDENSICAAGHVPIFDYYHEGKKHVYHPDIMVDVIRKGQKREKIIEVKSKWTYKLCYDSNIHKWKSVCEAGYLFEVYVYHNKGVLLRTEKYWLLGTNFQRKAKIFFDDDELDKLWDSQK
jgi:hypothetical protein